MPGLALLLERLPRCQLHELCLGENGIGVEGGKAVAAYVAASASLQQLTLNGNMLCGLWADYFVEKGEYNAEGVTQLAGALAASSFGTTSTWP